MRLTLNIGLILAITSIIILGCGKSDKAGGTSADAEQITIAAFKTLLDDEADVVIVDVRVKKEYDLGHIPGAISMVYPDEIESRYQELSTDKIIVLYWSWEDDGKSVSSAQKLKESGFKINRLKVLKGGYPDWQEAGYPIEKDWEMVLVCCLVSFFRVGVERE